MEYFEGITSEKPKNKTSKSNMKVTRDEKVANAIISQSKASNAIISQLKALSFKHLEEKREKRFNEEKRKSTTVIEVDETLLQISLSCFKQYERVIYTIPEEENVPVTTSEDDKQTALCAREKKKEKLRLEWMQHKVSVMLSKVDLWEARLARLQRTNQNLQKINSEIKEKMAEVEIQIGLKDKFYDDLYEEILTDINTLQNGFEETKMELYKRHLELRMFLQHEYSKYEVRKSKATDALFTCFGWLRRNTLFERIARLQRQQRVIRTLMKQSRLHVAEIEKAQLSWQ